MAAMADRLSRFSLVRQFSMISWSSLQAANRGYTATKVTPMTDRQSQTAEYPCALCSAPITTCELCQDCADDLSAHGLGYFDTDMEASGAWMSQDARAVR